MGFFNNIFGSYKKSGGYNRKTAGKTKLHSNRVPPKKSSSGTKNKRLSRTASGRVPQGRTLSTRDNYLGNGKKTGSTKERPVVVIEANKNNDLAVVPLSSREGKNRTRLKNYQQGQSYFKHYVEIEDDEGNPIRVNKKFKENHPNMDVSGEDVQKIKDKVLYHGKASVTNREKMNKFRDDKKE